VCTVVVFRADFYEEGSGGVGGMFTFSFVQVEIVSGIGS